MKIKYLFIPIVLFFGACGPNFSNPVLAPEPSLESVELKVKKQVEGRFYLKSFEDIRKDQNFIKYNGQNFKCDSDLTLVVREALSRILVRSGFQASKKSAIFIKGKLVDWNAEVQDGFPGTLISQVKVYLELMDPTGRRIYSGTYSGQAELQAPGLDNNDLRQALSLGMEKALEQVALDKGFVSVLKAY